MVLKLIVFCPVSTIRKERKQALNEIGEDMMVQFLHFIRIRGPAQDVPP